MFKAIHERLHEHAAHRQRFGGHRWGHRRHGGHGGPAFWFGGGGRLFESGEARLALLSLIAEKPRHGYEIMTEVEQRTGGAYRPSAGSIYPNLQQLEDEGLVTSAREADRTVYTITDTGKERLEAERDTVEEIWERAEELGEWGTPWAPGVMEIGRSFMTFAKSAVKAVTKQNADPDEVRAVLDRARKEIEALGKKSRR